MSYKSVSYIRYFTHFEYYHGKWRTLIDIVLLDCDEMVLETEIKQKRKFGHKGEVAMTFAPDFRDPADTYNDNRSQMQDKLSEFLPIDEQEDDIMY